ncbi:hypothetical protein J1614_000623 [Plenodomus biglobosus]|nr:hypothetical protein J1614_000623 [Plenodomus biglobosus]
MYSDVHSRTSSLQLPAMPIVLSIPTSIPHVLVLDLTMLSQSTNSQDGDVRPIVSRSKSRCSNQIVKIGYSHCSSASTNSDGLAHDDAMLRFDEGAATKIRKTRIASCAACMDVDCTGQYPAAAPTRIATTEDPALGICRRDRQRQRQRRQAAAVALIQGGNEGRSM